MAINRGYAPKHKMDGLNGQTYGDTKWKPRCARCGQFISMDAPSTFTPDSEFTEEKIEHFCSTCWEKENG